MNNNEINFFQLIENNNDTYQELRIKNKKLRDIIIKITDQLKSLSIKCQNLEKQLTSEKQMLLEKLEQITGNYKLYAEGYQEKALLKKDMGTLINNYKQNNRVMNSFKDSFVFLLRKNMNMFTDFKKIDMSSLNNNKNIEVINYIKNNLFNNIVRFRKNIDIINFPEFYKEYLSFIDVEGKEENENNNTFFNKKIYNNNIIKNNIINSNNISYKDRRRKSSRKKEHIKYSFTKIDINTNKNNINENISDMKLKARMNSSRENINLKEAIRIPKLKKNQKKSAAHMFINKEKEKEKSEINIHKNKLFFSEKKNNNYNQIQSNLFGLKNNKLLLSKHIIIESKNKNKNNSNDNRKNNNENTAIIINKRYNNFNNKINLHLKFRESPYKLNNTKYKGNHNLFKVVFNSDEFS